MAKNFMIVPRLRMNLWVLLAVAALPQLNAGDSRRKAIRREMIEMDIAVRNLASTIAMADRKVLDDSLVRLSSWQMKDHPDLGSAFRAILDEWKARGIAKHGTDIQKEAAALRNFVSGRGGKLNENDWTRIEAGYSRMLTSCQRCHEAARKEPR